jgi:hypothetical protein
MGSSKYKGLGKEYRYENVKPLESTELNLFREIITGFRIDCKIEQ